MKKQKRKIISYAVALGFVFQSSFAVAAGGRQNTQTERATESTTTSEDQNNQNNQNQVNNYNPTVDTRSTDTANRQAEKNKQNQSQGQGKEAGSGQNMGMIVGLAGAAFSGAMAAVSCTKKPPDPSCPLWIVGAVASAAVAMAMSGAKKKSDQTVSDVTGYSQDQNTGQTNAEDSKEMQETERNLRAATSSVPGLKADLKTGSVRFPDGRTLKASDLGNNAALSAAGFSGEEIAAFQDFSKKALQEGEKQAKSGLDSSAGSNGEDLSGGSGSRSAGTSSDDPTIVVAGGPGSRDPANTSGLTRDYNGEPIGVASDNIFGLINRRYEHVAGHNNLLVRGRPSAQPQ